MDRTEEKGSGKPVVSRAFAVQQAVLDYLHSGYTNPMVAARMLAARRMPLWPIELEAIRANYRTLTTKYEIANE